MIVMIVTVILDCHNGDCSSDGDDDDDQGRRYWGVWGGGVTPPKNFKNRENSGKLRVVCGC